VIQGYVADALPGETERAVEMNDPESLAYTFAGLSELCWTILALDLEARRPVGVPVVKLRDGIKWGSADGPQPAARNPREKRGSNPQPKQKGKRS